MDINIEHALKEVRESLASPALWVFVFVFCVTALFVSKCMVFVLASGVGLVVFFGRIIASAWRTRKQRDAAVKAFRSLSPDEKAMLTGYILGKTKTMHFDTTNAVAQGLVAQGILHLPAQHFDILEGMSFLIQPWAWDYLREHPELLKVTVEEQRQLRDRNKPGR
jgi:hypothetical protein